MKSIVKTKMNLLFICSRNQWRSPTGEELYRNKNGFGARSAGTEPSARIKANQKLIDWADVIFVMERKHKNRLQEKFDLSEKEIVVLDIPDDYKFMDPELMEMIELSVNSWIDLHSGK